MTSKILYWQAVAMSKAELFLFLKKQIETDNHEEEPFIMPFNRPKVNHTVPCDKKGFLLYPVLSKLKSH